MIEHDAEAGDSRVTLGMHEEDPMAKGAKADSENQITLRIQDGTKERADALAKAYAKDRALSKFGPWTRHRILRLALETGLDFLEVGEDPLKGPRKKK